MVLVVATGGVVTPNIPVDFTAFTLESNANDSLVAMLVVLALLVVRWPAARGASTALAGLTKFAPLGLAPMLATYDAARERVSLRPRVLLPFVAAFALTAAVVMLPVLFDGGLHTFYDRTLAYQGVAQAFIDRLIASTRKYRLV